MAKISLKKLISKKDVCYVINSLINGMDVPIAIRDVNEGLIFGVKDNYEKSKDLILECKYPVKLADEVVGFVVGDKKACSVADFINYLLNKELEKRALVSDMLDKYKEITLLYDIAEKLAVCLGLKDIAKLVVGEAGKLVKATGASIMLLKENNLEKISSRENNTSQTILSKGKGIAGHVLLSGTAEIVNDVESDPRYVKGRKKISSLICAPLRIKDRIIGVLNVSSDVPVVYESGDLKIFSILASQAASAIESAILYENKLKEEQIKVNLQRYVSPQIVNSIMDDSECISLKPTRKRISVLFSDIRNFTTTCEKLGPEQIVTYLNEYFTRMVKVIFENNGTINKFVGDMIVALFGAPFSYGNNEIQAIKTAINMQNSIKETNIKWIRDNFNTGIGVSSGSVVVGNIGSPQHMDYTAIGDEVNIADRLQSLAKGGQILVERNVYKATKDIFEFEKYGDVVVKGRKTPVEIFNVIY